ncbi:MAG TPA: type IVB secretion system protein IcmH/DotU [Planctomycetota bacterium]|nr:type IVB secretion system protein IcmH/DotU [Planctomycetota bacterium]
MTLKPGRRRISDLCAEAFAFALSLRAVQDPGDVESLRRDIGQLLERLGQQAREAGVDSTHLDQARYALCALIDEIVLSSKWEIKTQWMNQPLQMVYFKDFTAGEQFYQRLEALRGAKSERDVDLLEVYAQCLAVGFRGKYADLAGMQKIADLLDQVSREIRAARGVESRALSASFQRQAVLPEKVRRLPVWLFAALGAAFLLLLLFVLDSVLANQAAVFLATGEVR